MSVQVWVTPFRGGSEKREVGTRVFINSFKVWGQVLEPLDKLETLEKSFTKWFYVKGWETRVSAQDWDVNLKKGGDKILDLC